MILSEKTAMHSPNKIFKSCYLLIQIDQRCQHFRNFSTTWQLCMRQSAGQLQFPGYIHFRNSNSLVISFLEVYQQRRKNIHLTNDEGFLFASSNFLTVCIS